MIESTEYLVGKAPVTSGAKDRMHTVHEILVEDYLKTTNPDVDFVITEGPRSLRDDMPFEFVISGEKRETLSPTTGDIVDWCAGFLEEHDSIPTTSLRFNTRTL